jgi:predicted porin
MSRRRAMHRDRLLRRTAPAAVLAAALLLGGPASAVGADVGDECCADLEQRVTELEETTARKGNRAVSLKVWGYVNEAIMYWDDGFEDNVYIVTNEDERSRIAFDMEAKIAPKWSAGARIEIGLRANRENRVDQVSPLSPPADRRPDVRYSFWWLKNDDLGKLSVGRTRMATYHIVEMLTADTWYFAKQGIGAWIGDNGGGFFLRKTNGTLTTGPNSLRWGDIDAHGPNASPGDGDRTEAVTYATPDLGGFVATAGYSGQGAADVALRYEGDIGNFKLAAGIGYGQYTGFDIRRCAVVGDPKDVRCHTFGLSGSVMHVPSGLYVYGAYGQQLDLNRPALFQAPVDNVDRSFYVQAGVEHKFIDAGKTTILAEFERDEVGAGVNAKTGGILNTTALGPSPLPPGDTAYDRMAESQINTWGIGINQSLVDDAVNLYVTGRVFSADVFTSATGVQAGSVKTEIEPFLMILGGALIEF